MCLNSTIFATFRLCSTSVPNFDFPDVSARSTRQGFCKKEYVRSRVPYFSTLSEILAWKSWRPGDLWCRIWHPRQQTRRHIPPYTYSAFHPFNSQTPSSPPPTNAGPPAQSPLRRRRLRRQDDEGRQSPHGQADLQQIPQKGKLPLLSLAEPPSFRSCLLHTVGPSIPSPHVSIHPPHSPPLPFQPPTNTHIPQTHSNSKPTKRTSSRTPTRPCAPATSSGSRRSARSAGASGTS